MAQEINDNFNLLAGLPVEVDDRHQTISGRDNIPSTKRYTGRLCYVEQTQTLYMLVGGILNENWQPISGKTGVNDVSIYLVENYPFLWQKGRSDSGIDNENNVMEAGDIIMLGYCDYDDGSGSKNTLVRLAKYVSGVTTSISSYDVLIYDTTGVSNFKNDVRLPNISEDNTTTKIAVLDSNNKLAYVTELPASLLPPIAISKKVVATETTIASFAANSGNYTFEQGDTIILDSGNGGFYIFFGGAKTDVNSYTAISSSEVDWSQVTNVPNDVEYPDLDYVLKNGDQSSENIILGGFLRTDDNLVIKPSNGQMTGSAGYNSIGFFVDNVLFLKQVGSQVALRVSFDDITASRDISVQDFGGKIPLLSSTDVNDGDFEINGTLAAQNLILKAIAEDNAATKILVIDALGNTKYIDKSSIGGNFVTLDTNQTITGKKTYIRDIDGGGIINKNEVAGVFEDSRNESTGTFRDNGNLSTGVFENNRNGAGIFEQNRNLNTGTFRENTNESTGTFDKSTNESTGTFLRNTNESTGIFEVNRNESSGVFTRYDNPFGATGDTIIVKKQSVLSGAYNDVFKIDNEGNTTTQKLTIEDVAEDLTADKLAVIDADGKIGYIDKSSFVKKSGDTMTGSLKATNFENDNIILENQGLRVTELNASLGFLGNGTGNFSFGYGAGNGSGLLRYYAGTTQVKWGVDSGGNSTQTGSATATSFPTSSDVRLKENIGNLKPKKIDVKWKSFNFKKNKEDYRTGVIAQELEKTNPEFVLTDDKGYKSVKYTDLLISKIAELEERLNNIENNV